MKKVYFIVGSQDLYGRECLDTVAKDSEKMVKFLNEKLEYIAKLELMPIVETSEICIENFKKVMVDEDCIGVITWMHTFSPAKM
ncbi:MAG: L-arabinose isomerase, partial [Lachnoanaerobaculum saburreum]